MPHRPGREGDRVRLLSTQPRAFGSVDSHLNTVEPFPPRFSGLLLREEDAD